MPSASEYTSEAAGIVRYAAKRKAELACQIQRANEAYEARWAVYRMQSDGQEKRKREQREARARKHARAELAALDTLVARGSSLVTPRMLAQRDELVKTASGNNSTISNDVSVSECESGDDSG